MSLKTTINSIAMEAAAQSNRDNFNNQNNTTSSMGIVQSFYVDSQGNRRANVTDNLGNPISNAYIFANRPLGVGSAVSLTGTPGSLIGQ